MFGLDIKEVLVRNYMPYAKGTIVSRAIPAIDGLKPSNRRILYTMALMGLVGGDMKKSAKIVGQVMTYHPHGDSSIYETMVRMATGNESLNEPYIQSKGNFGKVWSKNMSFAASRYTEAKLAPICKELFDGLKEDAVDMVDNFDNTEKEPVLLPVKFPTVLVNASNGIAVGCSSNIAPFGLVEVCKATIRMLDGDIDIQGLVDILGGPELPTGGYIHIDRNEMLKLVTKGRGTFVVSGKGEVYKDKIIIKEIPYKSSVEGIVEDIKENMKGELKDVTSVKDLSDINGLRIQVLLKRGSDTEKVLRKINRVTKLRTQMTFSNTVIIDNRYKTLGVWDLINEWIKFRLNTVSRVYKYRYNKRLKQVHLLEAWEKIQGNVDDVIDIISKNTEDDAKRELESRYGLDKEQSEYILDIKLRLITKDRLDGKLKELKDGRLDVARYLDLVENESSRKALIKSELEEIIETYGKDRKSKLAAPIKEDISDKDDMEPIDDTLVLVVVTKKGYIKRLVSLNDQMNIQSKEEDPIKYKVLVKNNEDLLVYTYSGLCYKIPVHKIDSSKGIPKEYIYSLIDKSDDSGILTVVGSGDYSGNFNIVYSDGRGVKVYLSKVQGNRSKYRSQYSGGEPGGMWVVTEDKFFMITRNRNAAYINLEYMSKLGNRSKFKVGRIGRNDSLYGIQPVSKVPDMDQIDINKYTKGYCVKIKEDRLW